MRGSSKRLSKEDLKKFQELLIKERNRILKSKGLTDSIIAEEQEEHIHSHMADMGTEAYLKEIASSLSDLEYHTLLEIERALKKIKSGTYGLCEFCKNPISKERLKVIPYARLCIKCQSKLRDRR